MKFIYFGHSRFTYGTEMEEKAIRLIREKYPNYRLLNPNKEKHQINCNDFYTGVPGTEMEYFLNLTKMCEFGIFMVYDVDNWSPGSYTEATCMMKNGKEVYLLSPEDWQFRRIEKIGSHYTFDEESRKLKERGLNLLAGENG
jgi:hypothetical protein